MGKKYKPTKAKHAGKRKHRQTITICGEKFTFYDDDDFLDMIDSIKLKYS